MKHYQVHIYTIYYIHAVMHVRFNVSQVTTADNRCFSLSSSPLFLSLSLSPFPLGIRRLTRGLGTHERKQCEREHKRPINEFLFDFCPL